MPSISFSVRPASLSALWTTPGWAVRMSSRDAREGDGLETCHSALVRLEGHVRMDPTILLEAKAYGSERDDMNREMGD